MKLIIKKIYVIAGILMVSLLSGCETDWLDEQPLESLSASTFWNSKDDTMLALAGIYRAGHIGTNAYTNQVLCFTSATDDSSYKHGSVDNMYSGYFKPGDVENVLVIWNRAYTTIFRANYFLENIEKVQMDVADKEEVIAEVRFLRAYEYYYLSTMYGGVPLVTKVLSVEEANTQKRKSLQEIVTFCIDELTAAAKDLPATRPDTERGRILKGAALAVKAKLLMIHQRWAEAATTYKEIMDLNVHSIDPRYKELFEEVGETSKEIILSTNIIANIYGNTHNQLNWHPDFYGGYQETNVFQGLVDAFLMNDGLPIEESPLYDPAHPFDNRDPRLYASIFLPEYTEFRGILYLAHPSLTNKGIGTPLRGATGYGWKKYVTENYTGNVYSSGDDVIIIRYAEVLLGYLESKLESGDNITQDLLDQTINEVRGREAVHMPPVTETDRDKLREIVRNERRVEFCLEHPTRYIDIRRWDIYTEVMNQQFYGMKLTDTPETYTAYPVETTGKYRGHLKSINKTGTVKPESALLPIPIYEININPELEQNPGY